MFLESKINFRICTVHKSILITTDIPCKCNHDSIETEFPIAECLHCQFQAQEDSLPRQDLQLKKMILMIITNH